MNPKQIRGLIDKGFDYNDIWEIECVLFGMYEDLFDSVYGCAIKLPEGNYSDPETNQ